MKWETFNMLIIIMPIGALLFLTLIAIIITEYKKDKDEDS